MGKNTFIFMLKISRLPEPHSLTVVGDVLEQLIGCHAKCGSILGHLGLETWTLTAYLGVHFNVFSSQRNCSFLGAEDARLFDFYTSKQQADSSSETLIHDGCCRCHRAVDFDANESTTEPDVALKASELWAA